MGCSSKAFYENINISIGTPTENKNNEYFLPVSIYLKGIHSAQWIHKFRHKIKGSDIIFTSSISKPPFMKESEMLKGVNLGKVKKGNYKAYYRDPDRKKHFIGIVRIK